MSDSKPKSSKEKLIENLINFKTTKEHISHSNISEQKYPVGYKPTGTELPGTYWGCGGGSEAYFIQE